MIHPKCKNSAIFFFLGHSIIIIDNNNNIVLFLCSFICLLIIYLIISYYLEIIEYLNVCDLYEEGKTNETISIPDRPCLLYSLCKHPDRLYGCWKMFPLSGQDVESRSTYPYRIVPEYIG